MICSCCLWPQMRVSTLPSMRDVMEICEVIFGLCVMLFHLANAALLPLVGQELAAWVACEPHDTIGVVIVHGAAGLVDGKLIRVHADAGADRIGVGEDARLQHLCRG